MNYIQNIPTQQVQLDCHQYAIIKTYADNAGISISDYLTYIIEQIDYSKIHIKGGSEEKNKKEDFWTIASLMKKDTDKNALSDAKYSLSNQDEIIYGIS